MKIAILTQPLRANYGGVLQNYALQQILIKLGHTPTTIEKDYHQHISIFKLISEFPKRCFTKYVLKKRKHIFSEYKDNKYFYMLTNKLKPFVLKHIRHQYIKDYNSINTTEYYAFVVGSDQVWRLKYNGNNLSNMYLSFITENSNVKRIAYAASFGTCEWEYNDIITNQCKNLIQKFDAVSTREIDGVYLCKRYLKREDVVSVLDPTLLLNKEVYLKLCKDIPTSDDNRLFAYILDADTETLSNLKNFANANRLNLKLIRADEHCTLSIEEWLAMFRDAKCVITDSFHGTVFSIIFNKKFYTIVNQSRGSSRFTSLLSQLLLTERMFESVSNITINDNINWTAVNEKLWLLKEYSFNFLKTNLL